MKKAFATPILQRLACRAGVKVVVEPRYGYAGQVVLPDGTKRYFRGTNFDLNPLGASEIAKDKDYAAYFLRLMGYNTLDGEAFFTPDWNRIVGARRGPGAAYRYAKHIGFPVVVKPNSLSQGAMVTVVHNKRELEQAVRAIAKKDRVFLVQRLASGHDLRVVVLDGRIISAYERLPLTVAGDGRSTISQLLRKKQASFKRNGRDTIIKQDDFRITNRLRRFGLTRRSILAKGRKLALLDNRNLSSGGDAVDATGILHASFHRLCSSIARDMGLRYCGVDLMVEGDVRLPAKNYKVIEINAAPGIDNYASIGKKQRRNVEKMYLEVLRAFKRRSR